MIRILRDSDFLLAAFVFCASSIVAAYCYASIREIEEPPNSLISSVREGVRDFKIMSGNSCPGEFRTVMKHDAVWGMKADGKLRAGYGRTVDDVHLEAEAYFNPLGQLNSAKVRLFSTGTSAVIQLSNPHPISIDVQLDSEGSPTLRRHFSLPGPVVIAPNRDGSYRVEYSYIPTSQSPTVKTIQGMLSRELKLSVLELPLAPAACNENGEAKLDLLPIIIEAGSLARPLLMLATGDSSGGI